MTGVEVLPRLNQATDAALVGSPASDLPRKVGLLYSLCQQAQTIAALRAVETAANMIEPPEVSALRDILRRAEILSQISMRLALHWPGLLGKTPDPSLPRMCLAAQTSLAQALLGTGAGIAPGDGCPAPDVDRAGEIICDLRESIAGFSLFDDLIETLSGLQLMSFGTLPASMPPEGGSLSRMWNTAEVSAIRQSHGTGLGARLVAARRDLDEQIGTMAASLGRVRPFPGQTFTGGSGTGSTIVETARGPLRHDVSLQDGSVAHYRISAPTEENFRPHGPVEAGLIGAPVADLDRNTRLHVMAIDPCVEFDLEIKHA